MIAATTTESELTSLQSVMQQYKMNGFRTSGETAERLTKRLLSLEQHSVALDILANKACTSVSV